MFVKMVTTRNASPFAELQKIKCEEYFTNQYGNSNYTITRITETLNISGRPSGNSETQTLNVVGDLQFNTVKLKEYIDNGLAVLGDGVFYAPSRYDIRPNDELTNEDDVVYRLKAQVMGEKTQGQEIIQGWLAIRLPEE